jgi:hypothetical protein
MLRICYSACGLQFAVLQHMFWIRCSCKILKTFHSRISDHLIKDHPTTHFSTTYLDSNLTSWKASCSIIDQMAQDAWLWLIQDLSTLGNVDPLMSTYKSYHIEFLFGFLAVAKSGSNQDLFCFNFLFSLLITKIYYIVFIIFQSFA